MWTRKLNYLRKNNKIKLTFKSYFLYTDKRWLNTFLVTITYISTPSTLSRYMPKNWGRRVTPWHSTIYCTWEKEKNNYPIKRHSFRCNNTARLPLLFTWSEIRQPLGFYWQKMSMFVLLNTGSIFTMYTQIKNIQLNLQRDIFA